MIVFNGKSLTDFGCCADELDSLKRPEWDVTKQEIPGRSGALTFSNGRFKNITLSYDCMVWKNALKNYEGLLAFLAQDSSYHRLEAEAEKETFRMARFESVTGQKPSAYFSRIAFTLNFDCKPQRFLKSGEETLEAQNGSSFYNPTLYAAKPLLRVYGWGTVGINGRRLLLNQDETAPYTDIDCDLKDAFYGANNRNSFLEVTDWPELNPGENVVELGQNIKKIEITPRWWTI